MEDMRAYDRHINNKHAQRDLLVDLVTKNDTNVQRYLGVPSLALLLGFFGKNVKISQFWLVYL